jgi:hypothetical protein
MTKQLENEIKEVVRLSLIPSANGTPGVTPAIDGDFVDYADHLSVLSSRDHWRTKHERAYAVAMHNERVIARLETIIGELSAKLATYEGVKS